jgi:hypothetical protein
MKKLSFEFIKEVIESKGCKLISNEYTGYSDKIEILFSCGHSDFKTFENFKKGPSLCKKCLGIKKLTLEEVEEYLLKCGYYLENRLDYRNGREKVSFYDLDGYKYYYCFNLVKSSIVSEKYKVGKFGIENIYAFENIKNWIRNTDKTYNVDCEEFKGSHTRNIGVTCTICNNNWYTSWHEIYAGKGCPVCAIRINGERSQVRNVSDDNNLKNLYPIIAQDWDYSKNSRYPEKCTSNSTYKAFWKCFKCNYEWKSTIWSRTHGSRCPSCSTLSKGEDKIENYLKLNNIRYTKQYRTYECINKNPLPFDFAIWINNLFYLLEYQGSIHFIPVEIFGGEEQLIEVKKRDKIKKEYCLNNNVSFIEINYLDFDNIENILEKELKIQIKEEAI